MNQLTVVYKIPEMKTDFFKIIGCKLNRQFYDDTIKQNWEEFYPKVKLFNIASVRVSASDQQQSKVTMVNLKIKPK